MPSQAPVPDSTLIGSKKVNQRVKPNYRLTGAGPCGAPLKTEKLEEYLKTSLGFGACQPQKPLPVHDQNAKTTSTSS